MRMHLHAFICSNTRTHTEHIAPAIGVGLGAIGIGGTAFLGTTAGAVLVSSLFGVTGAGLVG